MRRSQKMKEKAWFNPKRIDELARWVRNKTSQRKLRLFGVACARLVWHLLDDERCRNAVVIGEKFAEGKGSNEKRAQAFKAACRARQHMDPIPPHCDPKSFVYYGASFACGAHACTVAENVCGYVWRH